MFSSLGSVNLRTNAGPAKNHSVQVPKGFSVRVFKGPTLSGYPYTGEPKFDLGYRPHSSNSWQKPIWSPPGIKGKSQTPPHDAPARTSRPFGNNTNADRHLSQSEFSAPSNYSIYPSISKDTYIYERSLCSKSDTYTESDATSDVTCSPSSCFSTALSNDSTTTLQSTALTESVLDNSSAKPSSSTPSSARQPFPVQIPSLAHALSSTIGGRKVGASPRPFVRPLVTEPIVRLPSSYNMDDATSATATAFGQRASVLDYVSSASSEDPTTSGSSYPSSTTRDVAEREPSQGIQARRDSSNRRSLLFGASSQTRTNIDRDPQNHSAKKDGQGGRRSLTDGSRTVSTLSPPHETLPSDGYSLTSQGDIYSASVATRSSPLRESSQTQPTPQLRRDADGVGYGAAESTRNNPEYHLERPHISLRRDFGDSQNSRTTSGTYVSHQNRSPESYLPPSTRVDVSSTSSPEHSQSRYSSRNIDGRRDSRVLPSLPSSLGESNTGGRDGYSSLTSGDSADPTERSSNTSGGKDQGSRDSLIAEAAWSCNEYRSTSSRYGTNERDSFDRQELAVPPTLPAAEIRTSASYVPLLAPGEPATADGGDAYSRSLRDRGESQHLHTEREFRHRDSLFVTANPSSRNNIENQFIPLNQPIHRNSDERQDNHAVSTLHPFLALPRGFSQTSARGDGDTATYSASATREQPRRQEFVQASRLPKDEGYNPVPPRRRESDERHDSCSSPLSRFTDTAQSYRYETWADACVDRPLNAPLNQSGLVPSCRDVSTAQQNRRSIIQLSSEPQRISGEPDNTGLRSTTPGGTRCVRWDPNLIAPSPIFASQRRKGWFNRRGDQLWMNDGTYKPPPIGQDFPLDLSSYPEYGEGWMNEEGVRIDMRHRLIPKPPLRSALKRA